MAEKSGLPTSAAISGVSRSLVSAVTTPPNAAPITTPTAISTTFPRRMNFLNPSNMEAPPRDLARRPIYGRKVGRSSPRKQLAFHWKGNYRECVQYLEDQRFSAWHGVQ